MASLALKIDIDIQTATLHNFNPSMLLSSRARNSYSIYLTSRSKSSSLIIMDGWKNYSKVYPCKSPCMKISVS